MNLSGEYRLKATPEQIVRQFRERDLLMACVSNCRSMVEIEPDLFLATVDRLGDKKGQVQYHFRFAPGEDERHFTLSFKAADPDALLLNGTHAIALKPTPKQDTTTLSYHSNVRISKKGRESVVDPSAILSIVNHLFDNAAYNLQRKDEAMTDKNSKLDEALHNAENAVVDLEHEAEQAAANGFLGGTQMWGWIALAVLVLGLLVFFR